MENQSRQVGTLVHDLFKPTLAKHDLDDACRAWQLKQDAYSQFQSLVLFQARIQKHQSKSHRKGSVSRNGLSLTGKHPPIICRRLKKNEPFNGPMQGSTPVCLAYWMPACGVNRENQATCISTPIEKQAAYYRLPAPNPIESKVQTCA